MPKSAKEVQAETKQSESVTNIRLYLGQQVPLSDLPKGELEAENKEILKITDNYLISANKKGSTKLFVNTGTDKVLVANVEVIANEKLDGLTFDEHSFFAKIVGTAPGKLTIPVFEEMRCTWSAKTPQYATVTEDGMITACSAGVAWFCVKVIDHYGGQYEFEIPLIIYNPQFEHAKQNLAKGCQMTLLLRNHSGNPVVYRSGNNKVLTVINQSSTSVVIKANGVGTTTVVGMADGVEFQCHVSVTNPKLKTTYGFYQKKKQLKLSLSGLNSASRPIWLSSNTGVATVNGNGKVKTHRYGSSTIRCNVDGKTLEYYLAVSTKTAVKAMRHGYKKVGKKKYSQARRMSKNYYDCSSFVYRAYRAAGKYLVAKTSWAPVAADIAKYYVRKKKNIKAKNVYSEKKLRPGDLVCFGGSGARRNGRYKRIYHIAMYIGNGRTMESSSSANNVVIRYRGTLKKKGIPVVVRPC